MSDSRFNKEVPHYKDTALLERCQEQIRDYDIHSKYIEPRNHTLSYISAAYIALAEKYDNLVAQLNSGVSQNGR